MTEYSSEEPMDAVTEPSWRIWRRVARQVDRCRRGGRAVPVRGHARWAARRDGRAGTSVRPAFAWRGEDAVEAHTITFTADPCTVIITLSRGEDGIRIDGWVAPAMRCAVDLHRPDGLIGSQMDDDGRFVIEGVPAGPASLVLRRATGPGRL